MAPRTDSRITRAPTPVRRHLLHHRLQDYPDMRTALASSMQDLSHRPSATEDRASPTTTALQLRRPPYFAGGLDEDVYVWTSIVSRWFEAIQGEPSKQLTYVVSLLRGAAYEWYSHYETCTGCPSDWTTLRLAMLERFGSSIHAEKARARLR